MRRYESPYHPVPDDYCWAKPDDVAEYCREFARELMLKGVKRSTDDRLKLTTHCAALLVRIAETITGSPHDGRSPEIFCRRAPPSNGFRNLIFEAKKSDRRVWIARAAQLVLANDTDAWLREFYKRGVTRLHLASESDDGFLIILRQLDDIWYQRATDQCELDAGRVSADCVNREGGEEQESWQERQRRIEASSLHTMHNSRRKRNTRWWEKEKKE